jgi:hypothetical protein
VGDVKLFVDHILCVSQFPEKAFDKDNLQILCTDCHRQKTKDDLKYSIKWALIEEILPVGLEETFDLEVSHGSHNYIANGIVTHNSQRYAQALTYEEYPARRQDDKNRQNSVDDMSDEDKSWFSWAQGHVWNLCYALYEIALSKGIAKEQARFLLPLNTATTIYMTGSARSWIHYLELRSAHGTQKEANLCSRISRCCCRARMVIF